MSDRERSRRRWVFWTTAGVSWMVLAILGQVALHQAARLLEISSRQISPFVGTIPMLSLAASLSIAFRTCRRLGIRVLDTSAETLVRPGTETPHGSHAPITIGAPPPAEAGNARALLLLSAIPWIAVLFLPSGSDGQLFAALVAGICTLLAVPCCLVYAVMSRCYVEAAEDAITRRSPLPGRSRHIPWEEVGSCTISTVTNALSGRDERITCVFRDRAGKEILRLPLAGIPDAERDRFLELVRAKHGHQVVPPELIATEAPEGTGTEPEAASAPQGTGTEMEAATLAMDAADGLVSSAEPTREATR